MKIERRIYLNANETSKIKANVSITIDDFIVIKGFKLIETDKGLFLANPNTKYNDEYHDTSYFINKDRRKKLEETIIKEYKALLVDEQTSNDL